MAEIKLTLFDNSHSFTTEALSKAILAENDPSQWQFAILSLIQAIELLLKERLRIEHPALIYANVDRRRNTVTLSQAVARLQQIAGLKFSPDDLRTLEIASDWRNRIVHSDFQLSLQALKPVFATLFGFLSHFHQIHLDQSIRAHVPKELWEEAISIAEYGKEIFTRAQSQMEHDHIDAALVWPCNRCGWEAFVIQDDLCLCLVCGHQEGVEQCEDCDEVVYLSEIEEIYVGNAKGLDAWVKVCSSCFQKRQEEDDRDSWDM